jgi:uncharacterized delta-60 repeat protein
MAFPWRGWWRRSRCPAAKPRPGRRPSPRFRPTVEGLESRTLLTGGLDPTFGQGGTVLTEFRGPANNALLDIAREPDGKLVALGQTSQSGNFGGLITLVRYNRDGSLDPSFGQGGEVLLSALPGDFRAAQKLAVQPDGKLVVGAASVIVGRFNPDGSVDTTFAQGGATFTSFNRTGSLDQLLVQPDGKILAVAYDTSQAGAILMARYNPDGSLDATFGTNGQVVASGAAGSQHAFAALQPDGKIVVAGTAQGTPQDTDFYVRRFNADGSLDTAFGNRGLVLVGAPPAGSQDSASAVAVQADGRIVVAGQTLRPSSTTSSDFAVARLNADGSPDATFGSGGVVVTPVGPGDSDDTLTDLVIDAAGRLVAGGRTPNATGPSTGVVVRYLPTGVLDPTFDTDGIVTLDTLSAGPQVLADGMQVVAAGSLSRITSRVAVDDFVVYRFDATGAPDPGFGTGGKVVTDVPEPTNTTPTNAAEQPDGKVVVVGVVANPFLGPSLLGLARYTPDGNLDPAFGNGGRLVTDFGSGLQLTKGAVAVLPDGKLLVAAQVSDPLSFPPPPPLALFRLNADGSLDTTFGSGGRVVPDLGGQFSAGLTLADVLVAPDGTLVVVGESGGSTAILRFSASGTLASPPRLTAGLSGLREAVVRPDGKILVTGAGAESAFAVGRFLPDGSPDPAFGTGGRVGVNFGGGFPGVDGLALQPDGRILLAGVWQPSAVVSDAFMGRQDLALVRLLPDGSPDPGFGSSGVVLTNLGEGFRNGSANAVAVVPDGRIIVAGQSPNGFLAAVYLPNGPLDTTFGNGGIQVANVGGFGIRLFVQPDGKPVAVGSGSEAFDSGGVGGSIGTVALIRYQLDPAGRVPADDNLTLVTELYKDFLGRTPDPGGLNNLLAPLGPARLAALADLALAFVASPEYRGRVVAGYYTTFLGRTAGAGEVAGWVAELQRGVTPEQVLGLIVGSDEYFQKAGGTNAAWLDRLYRDVLGRDRDSGSQGFLDALNSGQATRVQVALGVLASAEYGTRLVTQVYQTYLGRQPGDNEIAPRLEFLGQPGRPGQPAPSEQFLASVLGSPEYLGKDGVTNQAWLEGLYTRLLGRLLDAPGYDAALRRLLGDYDAQRLDATRALALSDEHARKFVTDLYALRLRRQPSAQEADFWATAIRRGATQEQVTAAVLGSDEYFLNVPGRTNERWVDNIYFNVLNRGPDPAFQGFVDALNAGRATREQVALTILNSPEARAQWIGDTYIVYLKRRASPADLAVWQAELARGRRREEVEAAIAASAEYFEEGGQGR